MAKFDAWSQFAFLLALAAGLGLPQWCAAAEPLFQHGRAVSLRVLQDQAIACQHTGQCADAVTHLGFLRRIDGFLIDRENKDLVLIGQIDPNWPKLHLQDFVIALRDAWHRYCKQRGNTLYLTDPGVSIDPYPKVIARLQEVGQMLDQAEGVEALDRELQRWHRVCHLPQKVRVEGIPFHTRFAATMLEVDYDLKRVADGSIELEIDGLQSLASRHLAAARLSIGTGEPLDLSTMSRFWFYPKPLRVRADESAAIIEPDFGLKVLTEEEYLDVSGQIIGKGSPESHARAFAESVSASFSEIAERRPAWRDLDNLAWGVALARTIRHRAALREAGLDIAWLLDEFVVPKTTVSNTVPGHSNVQREDYRRAVEGGYVVGALRIPSCGGVEMAARIEPANFRPSGPDVRAIHSRVSENRPHNDVLYWDF